MSQFFVRKRYGDAFWEKQHMMDIEKSKCKEEKNKKIFSCRYLIIKNDFLNNIYSLQDYNEDAGHAHDADTMLLSLPLYHCAIKLVVV